MPIVDYVGINDIMSLNEGSFKDGDTTAIRDELLPIVEKTMSSSSTVNGYRRLVNEFISARTKQLYDVLPCERIICSESEMDKLFSVVNIPKSTVKTTIDHTYFGPIEHFSPIAAKHEFTILMLLIIKYFNDKKMNKEAELALIHLSFSGKFYPSLHFRSYKLVTPARHVMEYVVNNMLTDKYYLSTEGHVLGAIRSIAKTWLESYSNNRLKTLTDYDVKYIIEQLYNRIGNFIKNIATQYYKAYSDKLYIGYSSDSLDSDDYHLADSDTLRISKYTEKTMNYINSNGVDYKVCKMASNTDITINECKAVIESIVLNPRNVDTMKELISLMLALYFTEDEGKNPSDIRFITYTIAPKPNAKSKEILRVKQIIEQWLSESGTAYMRRRSRIATRNAYERCVRMYFALAIHNSCR